MKPITKIFVLGLLSFCISGFSAPNAAASKNPIAPPQTGVSECRLKYGHKFFPTEIVDQVLRERKLKPELIANLDKQLKADDAKIHDIVWERAKTMHPNPFTNRDRKDDEKLYRDVVTNLFSHDLQSQGITKQKEIDSLFDEIQFRRANKMADCDGYAKYVKIKKGFMPIVRRLTVEEDMLDTPEAYDPRLREQILKSAK